jgi:Ca2+-binding RTX toxin-like protein
MITVQATKQQLEPAQQNRKDFAEQDRPDRKLVPAVLLLFLAGCITYLRSFLSVGLEAHQPRPDDRADTDSNDNAMPDEPQIEAGAEEEDVTGSTDRRRGSSGGEAPTRISLSAESEGSIQPDAPRAGLNALERAVLVSPDSRSFVEPVRAAESRSPPAADVPRINIGAGGGGEDRGGGNRGSGGLRPLDTDPPVTGGNGPGGNGTGFDPGGPTPGGTGTDPTRNRAPRVSGPVYLADTYGCQAFLISMLALLAGASDADGDVLHIENVSANSGAISQTPDGDWSFVHDERMLGPVKLTYTISDGASSVQQTAYFSVVEAPPIIGTSGDDNILGTNCADSIDAGDGNDNVDARDGNDLIIGGAGDDHIMAGAGNDVVYAGAGNDVVFAGAGNDVVFGGTGNDRIFGEDGDDTLLGEEGNDLLDGGAGNDILIAGAGDDVAKGGAGNDTLDGGDGNDVLDGGEGADIVTAGAGNDLVQGGAGNDVLFDGTGRDVVDAGSGNDHIVAAADGEADVYDGGTGFDALDYAASTAGITVDLIQNVAFGTDIGRDETSNFERVVGGSGNDTIRASSAALSMDGAAGDDTLIGGAGDDVIADGAGADAVSAGEGDDQVLASADAANDVYDGGCGVDTLSYATATLSLTVDLTAGSADGADIGHDLIASFEKIIGGHGDDHLIAGSQSISMTGGDGNDTFEFQRDDDDHEPLLIRKITDFSVGDRIVAAVYEISYRPDSDDADAITDMFDDIYLSGNQNNRPIRFRFEDVNDDQFTVVDVHDRPDTDDFFSIEVSGHHHFQFTAVVG